MNKRNLIYVIIPLILFVMLGFSIMAGITVNFEGWAYNESVEHMSPFLTNIVKGITHMGDTIVVIVFCVLLIAIPKTRKIIALPVSASVILSSILNIVLKNVFSRERPDILRLINETSYSFPSGHAMINASLYTMLVLLIAKYVQNKLLKVFLSVICIALTMAIGFSRIYLGVHYVGDVLGGWLIGFAVSALVYWQSNRKQSKSI